MRRFIVGIVIACVGALWVITGIASVWDAALTDTRGFSGLLASVVIAVLVTAGGILLLLNGKAQVNAKRKIEAKALTMINAGQGIDHMKIARELHMREADVRRIVNQSKAEGAIPE